MDIPARFVHRRDYRNPCVCNRRWLGVLDVNMGVLYKPRAAKRTSWYHTVGNQ